MTSCSNNVSQNCSNETFMISAPVSTNMVTDPLSITIQHELSSNVSLDGFQQVEKKNKKKFKCTITQSTI